MVKVSDAEFEVLKIIWDRGETTSSQVIEDLKDSSWNSNTIRTLIKRLYTKGAIEIVKKNGKSYTYRSTIDEEKYKNEMTLDLLKKFYHNSINEFILDYCDQEGTETSKEMQEILKNISDSMEKGM